MNFFGLNPEVAGQLGDATEMDYSVTPYRVERLEYVFDDWLGDDLLAAFPVVVVTERLASALEESSLTGFKLADMSIGKSEMFEELGAELPDCRWLQLDGVAGKDDFAKSPDPQFTLVVSTEAMSLLKRFTLGQCDIEPFRA